MWGRRGDPCSGRSLILPRAEVRRDRFDVRLPSDCSLGACYGGGMEKTTRPTSRSKSQRGTSTFDDVNVERRGKRLLKVTGKRQMAVFHSLRPVCLGRALAYSLILLTKRFLFKVTEGLACPSMHQAEGITLGSTVSMFPVCSRYENMYPVKIRCVALHLLSM